jgi:hypothetical protein
VAVPVPAEGTAPAAEPTGPAVAARYRSGTQRYAVVTAAYVELAQDGGALPETDSLLTRSYVTYVLGGGGAGQSVGGAVDSAFVTSRRAPATSQAVTVAVPFTGTLTTAGVRFAGDSAAPPLRCAPGAADALLGVAREVLFALPPTLAAGSVWQDSSSATTCRGNVPLTTRSVHEYRVADSPPEQHAAAPRGGGGSAPPASAIAGPGRRAAARAPPSRGTGIARGRLTFEPRAGRYTAARSTLRHRPHRERERAPAPHAAAATSDGVRESEGRRRASRAG